MMSVAWGVFRNWTF